MNTYQKVKTLALAHDIRAEHPNVHSFEDSACIALTVQLRILDRELSERLMPRVQQFIDGEIAAFELIDLVLALKDAREE